MYQQNEASRELPGQSLVNELQKLMAGLTETTAELERRLEAVCVVDPPTPPTGNTAKPAVPLSAPLTERLRHILSDGREVLDRLQSIGRRLEF